MAISARMQSLQDQRSAGLRRRILAPQNNSVNTIARKSALNETEIMVKRYNDGEIGNNEMLSFLQTTMNNPGMNDTDKSNLENQVRDFTLRIAKDNLEARYKNTSEGSAERLIAGQQLASFYRSRAESLESGTPAQSQALENAGIWNQRVLNDQVAIQKRERSMNRARMEQEVNMTPSNSSDNAAMKSQMYRSLADQAMQDGDELAAQRFLSQAQYEETRAVEIQQREEEQATKQFETANRKQVVDALNILADSYNDGQIDENQYLQSLAVMDQRINELGDTSLALSLNRTVNTVQKNLEAGGLRRTTTASGLPAVVGKGPAGNQSTDWDMQDYNYSDNLSAVQKALQDGDLYPEDYQNVLKDIVSERQTQIDSRLELLDSLAAQNPNQKITYEGRKQRVGDLLQTLQKEQQSFQDEYSAVMSGNGALFMVPPDQMNQSGSVKKSGKSYASFRVIDPSTLTEEQKMQYAADQDGVYHPVDRKRNYVDSSMVEDNNGYLSITDPEGMQQRVFIDPSGNHYTWGKQVVSLYDIGGSKPSTAPYTPGQAVDSRGLIPTAQYDAEGRLQPTTDVEGVGLNNLKEQTTYLPPKNFFEKAIQPQQSVTFDKNLNQNNLPAGLTSDMTKMSQPKQANLNLDSSNANNASASMVQQQPVKLPEMKQQQPVNINPQQLPAGLTVQQPQQYKQQPMQNLATQIKPVVAKATAALKQSPFDFLKNKIGSLFK